MSDSQQYFSSNPSSAHAPGRIALETRSRGTVFLSTDSGVFSKSALDEGSALLIRTLPPLAGKVLDLGCGYGAIGLSVCMDHPEVTAVTMVDVNPRAVELSSVNAQSLRCAPRVLLSDGFSELTDDRFDAILTNPPIRAGNAVFYPWFAQAFEHLNPGGLFMAVVRKKQGAPSILKAVRAAFGNCEVIEKSKGYWILAARKD